MAQFLSKILKSPTDRKFKLRYASFLLSFESAIVISLAFYLLFKGLTATNTSDANALTFEIIFFFILGVLILFLGFSIYRDKGFAKAPSILINLISLGVCWYLLDAGYWIFALGLALIAITILFFVASTVPPTQQDSR